MSQQDRFWIARRSDRAVLDSFNELARIKPGQATVGAVGISQQVELPTAAESAPLWGLLTQQDGYVVQTVSMRLRGCNLEYYRGGQAAVIHARPENPANPHFDEIVIVQVGDEPNESLRLESLAAISTAFPRVQYDPSRDQETHLAALQESRLDQLEKLNRDLVQVGLDYRKKVDTEIDEKRSKLESEFQAKQELLEAEAEAKASALDERARKLDEEKKRLDDSDNTTARRNIRDRMLEDVRLRTEQFGVSKTTVAKRKPVQIAMQTAVVLLAMLTLFAAVEIGRTDDMISAAFASPNASSGALSPATPASSIATVSPASAGVAQAEKAGSSPPPDKADAKSATVLTTRADTLISQRWVLWARLSLLSLGLVGTILYYIRWENNWAQRHADAEFNLQQFHVDVNRANWIIESCLEWKKSTSSDIPPELLASISRGLFSNPDRESTQVIHPADELASALFGAASKVRLKSGDSEVELDAKKVPKEAKV